MRRLFENLGAVGIPEPLIGQFLPKQFTRVREGVLMPDPEALVVDAVRDVLRDYAAACGYRARGE